MINIIKTIVTGFFLFITISQVQSQDAIFTLEDVSAGTGSSFCMDVNAENLMNIVALQFSVNWDETILDLTSITALNSSFAGANINTTGSASGVATFSFSSAGPGGVSMPNGDLFFRLCFDVIGPGGSSTLVDFTGTPTFIDILANNGGVFTPMNLVTQGGNVTIPTPLTFTMPDEIYAPGANFCLPVSVTNFTNLESIQSSINWDASVLQYDSVTAFNLSDLDVNSFGVTNAGSGLIGFSWNDDDSDPFNGVTVADGTTIFEMCFTVVGSVNDMTTIVFDDNPIPVEVVEFGISDNLGLVSEGGKINIQQTIFITNSTLTQPNCSDANGGAINISVAGGSEPYTYLWSNDSTSQDLTGLGVGNYTVTITDSSMPANVYSSSFSLFGDFMAPTAMTEVLDTISCSEPTTVLDGTGSSTGNDIVYEWIHDAGTATILNGNTLMPTVNALGTYELIVTDTTNGCTDNAFSFVSGDVVPPIVDAGESDTLNCFVLDLELNGTVDPLGIYTYLWTTVGGNFVIGQNTPTPTVDQAGTYIFTVTEDGTGCMATDTVEVALNNDTPSASAEFGPTITCSNPEVTLDGSASSSGSLIIYSWSGPGMITNGNTTMPTVDAVGTYTLTVTNTYSQCTDEALVIVGANLAEPTTVVSDMNDEINCTTMSIMLDGTGSSTGDFTYLWTTNGGDIATDETTLMPTVTAAGEYILTVTDTINGCTSSDTTMVTQDANIPIANAGSDRTLSCDVLSVQLDGSDSSIGAEFKYLWITGTGNIVTDPTSIAPIVDAGGIYTLEVLDTINNCIATSSMTVFMDTIPPLSNPIALGVITCSSPEVTLSQMNGIPSGVLSNWETLDGSISGSTPQGDLIVNGVGTYDLILEDISNGCKDTASVVVMDNLTSPDADAGADFALDCEQIFATLDGSNSSTGTDYIYQWSTILGNAIGNSTTLTPSISSAGEYEIMVTDIINGCVNLDTVVVTESDDYPIVEAGANGTITCTNPEITLDASLVSSSGPDYFIEWVAASGSGVVLDGNENTLMPTVNEPGGYILTITNLNNNCSASDQLFVSTNNTPPTAIVVQDTLDFGCDESIVTLDGTGSTTAGVEYFWKTLDGNILGDTDELITEANIGGTYTLCVTNTSNGCSDTATIFVEEMIDAPILNVDLTSNITCNNPIVTLDGSGTILLPNQIFQWVTGPNGNYIPGTTDGFMPMVDAQAFYTLVVTDTITGCVFQDGALVLVDTSLVMATAMADGNLDCVTSLVNLEATVNSSSMIDVIYNWTASMGGNITTADPMQLNIQADAAGIYEFVALDTLTGCSDTISLEIINDSDAPSADAGTDIELPCTATSIFLDGSGSSTGDDFTYLWTTGDGSIITGTEINLSPEVDALGTYTLTVTDTTNGCFSTAQVEVISSQAVIATATTPVNLDCGVISIVLDGSGSTAGGTITYLWTASNGGLIDLDGTTLMPQVSSAGTYTLLVTDTQSGCTAMTAVEVIFNNTFPLADVGSDLSVCESTTNLEGNLPTDVTGIWLSLGNGIPTDPSSPTTEVTNLQIGDNIFVWTISAIGCPEYSSDTVIVTVDEATITNDDTFVMEENQVLDLDVSINDIVGVGQFTDITTVGNGLLSNNGAGNFTYTPNVDFTGTETFEYEFCSDICLDACDTSLVTITINPKEPLPVDSLINQKTNTITANDDGLNDVFVFDILEQNSNEYINNEFIVFNRWGDVVYEAKPYNNDWGGTNQNGKPLPEGTYYYILRLDLAEGIVLKGDVTILR